LTVEGVGAKIATRDGESIENPREDDIAKLLLEVACLPEPLHFRRDVPSPGIRSAQPIRADTQNPQRHGSPSVLRVSTKRATSASSD
jgi:hypothetical protein